MTEGEYYHMDESVRKKKMVLNMSEDGGVVWYTKETTQIETMLSAPLTSLYTPHRVCYHFHPMKNKTPQS